jgi:WD repeat-containing protein 35
MTSSDENGLIIVWMMHKGNWFEEMINNRNKSVVRDMRWSANGEKICIVYEDGAVIVGSVEGNRLWGKELKINLAYIEWSPDGRTILFGTPEGEVKVYDYVGNYLFQVKIYCLKGMSENQQLSGLQWYFFLDLTCLLGLISQRSDTHMKTKVRTLPCFVFHINVEKFNL